MATVRDCFGHSWPRNDRSEQGLQRLNDFRSLVSRLSAEVPTEFLDGVSEITVSPRAVPHPTRADIFTLGHCIPFHAGETGAPDEIQSRVVLYHGSFRALAELDADFDWRTEAWETLTHELRHHLEWRAREGALEAFDEAAEQNFARTDGEPFDPLFHLSGESVADAVYQVDDDFFLDHVVRRLPDRLEFAWHGRPYRAVMPAGATLPAFLSVEGVATLLPGEPGPGVPPADRAREPLPPVAAVRGDCGGATGGGRLTLVSALTRRRNAMRGTLLLGLALVATPLAAQTATESYRVGVVSESGDIITWLRPEGKTLVVDHVVPVGVMPADIDGPHNITVSADQRWYYVSIAHGTPYGTLWRFDARNDTLAGRAQLEFFPTTIAVTPDGDFAFVANSDFHGDHPRVNSVSAVYTPDMTTITDIPACDMPHGVKVNHAGTAVWVSCMHSDELLQIDVATFDIVRRAKTGSGMTMPAATGAMAGMNHGAPATAPAAGPRGGQRVRPDVRERLARRPHPVRGLQSQGDAAGVGRRRADDARRDSGGRGRLQRGALAGWASAGGDQQEGAEREHRGRR